MARTRWRAWEDLRRFWDYRRTAWAARHLRQWLWRASHSRLRPFQKLAHTLRAHRDGVLAWTRIRVTNGAGSSGSVRSSGNTSKWIVFFRRAAFAKGQAGKSPTTRCGCSMNSSDHRSMAAMASSGFFDLTGGKPSADRGPCGGGRACTVLMIVDGMPSQPTAKARSPPSRGAASGATSEMRSSN